MRQDRRDREGVESLMSQALFSSDAKLEQPKKQKRVVVKLHKEAAILNNGSSSLSYSSRQSRKLLTKAKRNDIILSEKESF